MASSPPPPVPFKDHCAIVHNNTLYVYQPDAFQILELRDGAEWKQEQNGQSVQGGVCVKGGIEGDSLRPALYVVGGMSSDPNYPGLQRYSMQDKSWSNITPDVKVTAQRQFHGATYLNASSALIVYGGTQDGSGSASTETFLMLMYPPYRVQAYSSIAPAVRNPQLHQWDKERAVMVGGTPSNQDIYIFHPDTSWTNLGLTLPTPVPDPTVGGTSLVILDDNSKILLTYRMDQTPNTVTRNVLMGPFGQPAVQGQTVGDATSTGSPARKSRSRFTKRSVFLNTYKPYNATDVLSTPRTGFAIASGSNELTAIVGGDSEGSTAFFNKVENGWISAEAIVGEQKPLVSTTTSITSTPTPTRTATATATTTSAAVAGSGNGPNSLAILGGVLGGICGLAAILIIILLWLRQTRRKRTLAAQSQQNTPRPEEGKNSFETQGMHPLSEQGQPMGRSPVPSAVMDERDSIALFNPKFNEKAYEAGLNNKVAQPNTGSGLLNKNPFTRQQSPLTISKPMMADLGDYKERPSIELGKATPVAPVIAVPSNLSHVVTAESEADKKDQRKTDEGWAAYFQSFQSQEPEKKRDTVATTTSSYTNTSAPPSRSGGGGFWPGSGVAASIRSSKAVTREETRAVTTSKVIAASPTLQTGPSNPKTLTMSTAEGIPARISRAESISTDATDDDDYEDDRLSAYSSGVPQVAQHSSWTPFGNGSTNHVQTVSRPVAASNTAISELDATTTVSQDTSNSGTTKSSIPVFPMPAATVRRVQPSAELHPPPTINPADYRTSEDYFSQKPVHALTQPPPLAPLPAPPPATASAAAAAGKRTSYQRPAPPRQSVQQDSTDMSWINLGTPVPQQSSRFSKVLYNYLLDDVSRKQIKPTNKADVRTRASGMYELNENRRAGANTNNHFSVTEKEGLTRTRSTKQPGVQNSSAKWAQDKEGYALQAIGKHQRQESKNATTRPEMKIGYAIGGEDEEARQANSRQGNRRLSF